MIKVGAHVIVKNQFGEILLVRRNYLECDWLPPGGRMELNESIIDTAVRECLEETGYVIKINSLVALGSRPATNDIVAVFEGEVVSKTERPTDPNEISEIGFFPMNQLPSPMKAETKR